jgi:hypothetical protein
MSSSSQQPAAAPFFLDNSPADEAQPRRRLSELALKAWHLLKNNMPIICTTEIRFPPNGVNILTKFRPGTRKLPQPFCRRHLNTTAFSTEKRQPMGLQLKWMASRPQTEQCCGNAWTK